MCIFITLACAIQNICLDCGVSMRAEERILGGLEAGFKQFPWAAIVTVTGKIV